MVAWRSRRPGEWLPLGVLGRRARPCNRGPPLREDNSTASARAGRITAWASGARAYGSTPAWPPSGPAPEYDPLLAKILSMPSTGDGGRSMRRGWTRPSSVGFRPMPLPPLVVDTKPCQRPLRHIAHREHGGAPGAVPGPRLAPGRLRGTEGHTTSDRRRSAPPTRPGAISPAVRPAMNDTRLGRGEAAERWTAALRVDRPAPRTGRSSGRTAP